jgi:hypothetical protein
VAHAVVFPIAVAADRKIAFSIGDQQRCALNERELQQKQNGR